MDTIFPESFDLDLSIAKKINYINQILKTITQSTNQKTNTNPLERKHPESHQITQSSLKPNPAKDRKATKSVLSNEKSNTQSNTKSITTSKECSRSNTTKNSHNSDQKVQGALCNCNIILAKLSESIETLLDLLHKCNTQREHFRMLAIKKNNDLFNIERLIKEEADGDLMVHKAVLHDELKQRVNDVLLQRLVDHSSGIIPKFEKHTKLKSNGLKNPSFNSNTNSTTMKDTHRYHRNSLHSKRNAKPLGLDKMSQSFVCNPSNLIGNMTSTNHTYMKDAEQARLSYKYLNDSYPHDDSLYADEPLLTYAGIYPDLKTLGVQNSSMKLYNRSLKSKGHKRPSNVKELHNTYFQTSNKLSGFKHSDKKQIFKEKTTSKFPKPLSSGKKNYYSSSLVKESLNAQSNLINNRNVDRNIQNLKSVQAPMRSKLTKESLKANTPLNRYVNENLNFSKIHKDVYNLDNLLDNEAYKPDDDYLLISQNILTPKRKCRSIELESSIDLQDSNTLFYIRRDSQESFSNYAMHTSLVNERSIPQIAQAPLKNEFLSAAASERKNQNKMTKGNKIDQKPKARKKGSNTKN